jgi:hypothetical protein
MNDQSKKVIARKQNAGGRLPLSSSERLPARYAAVRYRSNVP